MDTIVFSPDVLQSGHLKPQSLKSYILTAVHSLHLS